MDDEPVRMTIPPTSVQKAARKVLKWMVEENVAPCTFPGIDDLEGWFLFVRKEKW